MPKKNDNDFENKSAERPLECGECRKHIAVRYTEIIGKQITTTIIFAGCPQLERRLNGIHSAENIPQEIGYTRLACGNCGTTLEQIRVSTPLGCSHCYEVFNDILISELESSDKIPSRLSSSKKRSSLHIGRSPGQLPEINPSARLMALNEALNETLKREDYEQAASLRDQIKALTENPEKKDD
jgi:protein arginine kinase activator